ncbi:MAG TPA: hypothetical protein DCM40_12580 [Maribacter sp.]|nr:hypothetical protein [Maribacter sp.]
MARKIIDTGTLGNTATGDTIRTAMTKANENFLELYTDLAATTSSNGNLTNADTNGDVKIFANGTGIVEIDRLSLNNTTISSLDTNADITIQANGTGGIVLAGPVTAGEIVTNEITSNGSNANLKLKTAGNGDFIIDTDGQVGIGTVNSPDTKVHIKSASSIVTLQRTADANKPGIDFQNSNGNVRAELRMDGTDGTSNTVFVRTYDGSSTAERFRVEHTGASVTGTLNIKDDSDSSLGDATISMAENKITAGRSNDSLLISASGTGEVEILSNLLVQGATPFVKIQRTDNANVPGIDFIGQAGTSGAKILFDGTSGTSNELILQTFDGSSLAERFRVQQAGAKVTGILKIGDGSITDNYVGFGDADDLKIFHNGSHSIIRETGTGSLYVQSDNNVIIGKDSGSETMIKGVADGAVELYHDNSKKFETTSGGVSVTGNLAADGSQIDFTSLPTSDPGVAGRLFRSGNDVKISTG